MDSTFFWNELYRCRGNTLTMCEFHESTCNGFGDIWWTDNPIYFSSIDIPVWIYGIVVAIELYNGNLCLRVFTTLRLSNDRSNALQHCAATDTNTRTRRKSERQCT